MILAVDIGNTNIVVGCLEGKNVFFECRVATDKHKTEAEYTMMFKNLLDVYGIALDKISGTVVSSVVPPITSAVKNALRFITGYKPIEANIKLKHNIRLNNDNPNELGNDLLVAAVAALKEHEPPLVIVDLGTATTISVLDKDGLFQGCVIMPGVKISLEALSSRASQLPSISLEAPECVIGKHTAECMQSGIVYGNAAMLDGMIDRIEEELGAKTTVIATGGLAKVIAPYCKHKIICDDELMLRGLWYLYQDNC
ncbi:MAG: type III pantothenate kinase [Clostridia bacterium]|nr:type III pantothenate kinase [Clostridia bacterium]